MSQFDLNNITQAQKSQYAVVFSMLCLNDAGLELNEENINKALDQSGNKVESYWPGLFVNALEGKDINSFLTVTGGATGGNNTVEVADADDDKEDEVSEEEADVSMGDLFGSD
jgi:ribosomal protein L12E/L44/L45/RPP1/RPP2